MFGSMIDERTHQVLLDLLTTGARIEAKLEGMGKRIDEHVIADTRAFDLLRTEAGDLRDGVNFQLEQNAKQRDARLDVQDILLKEIRSLVDRARGVWWAIGVVSAVVVGITGIVYTIMRILKP